jgi:DNA-cytosine methyltransferase
MLRHLDLFSGIGGFSLGLESTGFFKTIGFVEKDKHCQQVLKKHWNNINIEEDIRNVKGERYKTDVITGGFPCQPFSVAGKRKGTDDDRYLWDEMFRVIRETKPRWVIGENVDGIININNGLVLRQVQTDLENEGFQVQCLVIPAAGIGAWHMRKRVWIICNSKHNGLSSTKIRTSNNKTNDNCKERQNQTCELEGTSRSKDNGNVWLDVSNSNNTGDRTPQNDINENRKKIDERRKEFTQSQFSRHSENVSHSCSFELNGRNNACRTGDTEQYRVDSDQKEEWNKIWSEVERCSKQGTRRTWWQIESELCGIPNGVSTELHKDRTQRLKMLGNSIVPQIARQLGLAIMKAENGN